MLIGLRGFVLLHPSVTHNLKASLIFRKRSEPEPTPSPDPAAPQAARDLASRRYSHSRRVQARRLIDLNAQTRSPRPSPAAHAVLSVRATTRMAPCRGWCPHPTTTPSLRISARDQTACKAGAKVLRLLRLPVMSDAVLQTKGRARRRTRRTCSVGNAKATCCLSSCSLRRDPCYAGTRSKSTPTLHRCTRM